DTLNSSIRDNAFTSLGPADIFVTSTKADVASEVHNRLANLGDPRVDGTLSIHTANAAVAAGDLADPRVQAIEMDFAAAAAFGGGNGDTGVTGPSPGPGRVVV